MFEALRCDTGWVNVATCKMTGSKLKRNVGALEQIKTRFFEKKCSLIYITLSISLCSYYKVLEVFLIQPMYLELTFVV